MRGPGRLLKDKRAATSIEYALICALVFLALVGGVTTFGSSLTNMLYIVATKSSTPL